MWPRSPVGPFPGCGRPLLLRQAFSPDAIDLAEDRQVFKQAMQSAGLGVPEGDTVTSLDQALGEFRRPLRVVPPVTTALQPALAVVPLVRAVVRNGELTWQR